MTIPRTIFLTLALLAGCQSALMHTGNVHGAFDKIGEHTSAARALLKQDLSRPNIKQADDELANVPPLIVSGKIEASAVQTAFDNLAGKWYVRYGRPIDLALKTILWAGVALLVALGAANYMLDGVVGKVLSTAWDYIVPAIKVAAEGPAQLIHQAFNWIAAKFTKAPTVPALGVTNA